MKKIAFFFYVFVGIIIMDSYSCPVYVIRPQGAIGDDTISLKGSIKWQNAAGTEIMNTHVSKTSSSLHIGFITSLGHINITIMDQAQNILFESAIYADAGDCEVINISKLTAGEYSIHISKEGGGLLSGKFNIRKLKEIQERF